MSAAPTRRALVVRGLALAAALALGLSACTDGGGKLSEDGAALTSEQASELAQARFKMYTERTFVARVAALPDDDVAHYAAQLTVDTRRHRAWGTLATGPSKLAYDTAIAYTPDAAAQQENGAWVPTAWSAQQRTQLAVVFSLSADRPENAQLLAQSGARYLGCAKVGEHESNVYRLPAESAGTGSTRLWVGDDGSVTRLDNGSDDFTVLVGESDAEPEPQGLDAVFGASTGAGSSGGSSSGGSGK